MVVRLNINTHIPEDRKIVLQLPAETPIGNVHMQLTIEDQQEVEPIPILIPDFPPRSYAKSGLVREVRR
jgi:hypothetical protein